MNNNITNCIVVGLIAIVLVLFLYYNNPLIENTIKEGFYEETTTTPTSGGEETTTTPTSGGEETTTTPTSGGEATTTTPVSGGEATTTTPVSGGEATTTTPVSGKEDNTTRVTKSLKREYVKSILALDKLELVNSNIDAIKKKIKFTTRKIKDLDTDYIDVYDIEDDINSDGKSKLDELETVSENPNIKQFVKQIRLIGNEDGDFSKVDRNQDFFLNMINGVAIDINFVNNYVRDFNDTIETETLVEELLPNNFEGTQEDKKRYKDYTFNTCIVEISEIVDDVVNENNARDVVILTLEKEINIGDNNDDNTYNYLEVLNKDITDDKKKCKSIFAIQKCIVKIVLNEDIKINADTNFKNFVENINVPESSFSYELGFRYISMTGQEIIPVKGIYKVELYLNNVEYQTTSMNKWLQDKINTENKELLNEKLEKIITPMFDLDNEIEKRSKVVKRIHDIYRFNKLNNSRNTMRFYNSHY